VRRPIALVLTLALAASALGLIPVAASATPPGDTPDTGNLYVDPVSFSEGQSVQLTANSPSGNYMVTFYKQTGTDTWTSIGTDPSNDSGNSYLTYQVNGTQTLYARITSGGTGRTETKTLTPTPAPVVAPTGPDTGNLYQSPTVYSDGDSISMTANFPSGTFPITLYKEGTTDTWTEVATKTSNSSGNATFTGFPVTSTTQRVFARKANNDRTEVDDIKPTPKATLSIRRDCTGNDCGSTATASGALDPAQVGRQLTLQRLSGSSWVSVTGASAATTGADGKAEIQFPLEGVPQWTARSYRLQVQATASDPAITSNTIQFMPGPTELGKNVLRVDVDKGVFPTTKGPEYEGVATLSTNGTEFLKRVDLENFGVRGSSTTKYPKKPYKLKFDKSPKTTGVFGMPADKSWTLLASFIDWSLVRDKVGLDLGRRMSNIAWTPDSRYVEMFVNDQYVGAYLMTESVKIDTDRVNVDPVTGMVMEVDGTSVEDSSLGFLSTIGKIAFAFKDPDERKTLDTGGPDPEGVTTEKFNAVKSRINTLESRLYSSSLRAGPDGWQKYIDLSSTVDYYLIKEFTKDVDASFYRSHYFWWDPVVGDDKFHFGPAWDFDRSAGVTTDTTAAHVYLRSPAGWYLRGTGTPSGRSTYTTHWFVQLFKDPLFANAVKTRWNEVRDEFAKVGAEDVAGDVAELGAGAENDRDRWAGVPRRFNSRGSFADDINYVTNWYEDRFTWMDGQLSN